MDTNEAPANTMNIMSEATEAAAGMLPLDMVNAIADLADPATVAKEMPWLAEELTKIALGQSDIAFDKRDKRFADEAWRTVPYFKLLGQSYRLFEMWMDRMYQHADGTWQNKARAASRPTSSRPRWRRPTIWALTPKPCGRPSRPAACRSCMAPRTCCTTWPRAGCPR